MMIMVMMMMMIITTMINGDGDNGMVTTVKIGKEEEGKKSR